MIIIQIYIKGSNNLIQIRRKKKVYIYIYILFLNYIVFMV